MIDSLQSMKADSLDCSANLYWRIITKGEKAIPSLIEHLDDTTSTLVPSYCKGSAFSIGDIAYFALAEIGSFPIQIITSIQFDLFIGNCWTFYDFLFKNENKPRFKRMMKNWYGSNASRYRSRLIAPLQMTECRRKYGITHYLEWND